jgi:hypothetical protein
MPLLDSHSRAALLENGRQQQAVRGTAHEVDFEPVVKLFTPDAAATWLLTELDPDEPDLAFGLCDLGLGAPELGYVRISELERIRGRFGLPLERDRYFRPDRTLKVYADLAREAGAIRA